MAFPELPAPKPPDSDDEASRSSLVPLGRRPPVPGSNPNLKPLTTPRPSALIKPRVKLASTSGDGVPLGASLTAPRPSPLPARGAALFLFLNLLCAAVAATFTLLILSKL